MRRYLWPVVTSIGALGATAPAAGQTLAAKPSVFGDPVPGSDASKGELVLGRTTLAGAQRIFAEQLEKLSKDQKAHANPDTLPADTEWQVGEKVVRPRHVLELGPHLYRLFFDRNRRLVAAVTFQPPRKVTREDLKAHYPTLAFEGRRIGAADAFTAPLGKCVSFAGRLRLDTRQVDQMSYVYTCATKPGAR